MKAMLLDKIVPLLLIVGGLTLGLTEVFEFNPIETILGDGTTGTTIAYIVLGVAGILGLYQYVDNTMHHKSAS